MEAQATKPWSLEGSAREVEVYDTYGLQHLVVEGEQKRLFKSNGHTPDPFCVQFTSLRRSSYPQNRQLFIRLEIQKHLSVDDKVGGAILNKPTTQAAHHRYKTCRHSLENKSKRWHQAHEVG